MLLASLLIHCLLFTFVKNENLKFENFKFGVSTSSYQIEGGWNSDGKGLSIWDDFTHNHPELIADGTDGDIAADSYNFFEKDLNALNELGVDFYRFSISWPRILPNGDLSNINQAGIDYYNNVINKLLENGIEPMVTMYHFDLPLEIQKIGGFANPLFVDYFEEYANVLFNNFGDRVKLWITFNEPFDYCLPGYAKGIHAPGIKAPGIADYLCMHHTLKAHAVAYRLYDELYYDRFKGKVGLCINIVYHYSKTNDTVAANRALQFRSGWLTHAVLKTGNYPDIMIKDIYENSMAEGRSSSRLPEIDGNWQNIIRGTADFVALNYYNSYYAKYDDTSCRDISPSWECDVKLKFDNFYSRPKGKSAWLYSVPEGLTDVLRWLKNEYNNIEVIITENGWSDDGQLDDVERIDYIKDHLRAVLRAKEDYGCNVTGYSIWSLLDNFEWSMGYTEKFGLFSINSTSPGRERIPKASAGFYKSVIKSRQIPD